MLIVSKVRLVASLGGVPVRDAVPRGVATTATVMGVIVVVFGSFWFFYCYCSLVQIRDWRFFVGWQRFVLEGVGTADVF